MALTINGKRTGRAGAQERREFLNSLYSDPLSPIQIFEIQLQVAETAAAQALAFDMPEFWYSNWKKAWELRELLHAPIVPDTSIPV